MGTIDIEASIKDRIKDDQHELDINKPKVLDPRSMFI